MRIAWKAVTGAGETIQTISGAASLASTAIKAAKVADVVGDAQLAYGFAAILDGVFNCL